MFKILKLKNLLILIIFIMLTGVLAVFPSVCMAGAKEGLLLSVFTVFPSVFPFMVLARYLTLSGLINFNLKGADRISMFLFGLPQEVFLPLLAGSISGYPTGAAVICDMTEKKIISRDVGEHMLGFCNNCSPLFIIGTVGTALTGSTKVGYVLFLIHIVSACLTGMVLKPYAPYVKCRNDAYIIPATKNPFTSAVSSSVSAMLNICGYITLFSVITKVLIYVNDSFAPLCGILEMTNGINQLALMPMNSVLKISLISAIMGFSGICVLLQTSDFASRQDMSIKKYIFGKIIFASFSFILASVVFSFNDISPVFNGCTPSNQTVFTVFTVVLTLMTLFILSIKNKLQ